MAWSFITERIWVVVRVEDGEVGEMVIRDFEGKRPWWSIWDSAANWGC